MLKFCQELTSIMPTLNRVGRDAVVNHQKEVPFRLLKCIEKVLVAEETANPLIQGYSRSVEDLLPTMPGS